MPTTSKNFTQECSLSVVTTDTTTKQPSLIQDLAQRFKTRVTDVILSVYLFNEQRGFRYLDNLAKVFAEKYPKEEMMLRSIQKHSRDERRHYQLFCRYFENRGYMPYATDEWCGYCDQIVKINFGVNLEQLDSKLLIENDETLFRLFRLIMITEMRGMRQVDLVLEHWLFRNPELAEIFQVIKKDEPSHCYPYQSWLRRHQKATVTWRESFSDIFVNYSLMLWKLPYLILNPFLKRRSELPLKL